MKATLVSGVSADILGFISRSICSGTAISTITKCFRGVRCGLFDRQVAQRLPCHKQSKFCKGTSSNDRLHSFTQSSGRPAIRSSSGHVIARRRRSPNHQRQRPHDFKILLLPPEGISYGPSHFVIILPCAARTPFKKVKKAFPEMVMNRLRSRLTSSQPLGMLLPYN